MHYSANLNFAKVRILIILDIKRGKGDRQDVLSETKAAYILKLLDSM